ALVNWTRAERLWQGQALLIEPHQGFAYAAGAGFRVPAGLGVTLMPFRHPYEAALQARSLAMATGHPAIAGFGPGARGLQQGILGAPYRSPLTAAREYLTAVRALLSGKVVRLDGEYFTVHAQLPPRGSSRGQARPRRAAVGNGRSRRRTRRRGDHLAHSRRLHQGHPPARHPQERGGGRTSRTDRHRDRPGG